MTEVIKINGSNMVQWFNGRTFSRVITLIIIKNKTNLPFLCVAPCSVTALFMGTQVLIIETWLGY